MLQIEGVSYRGRVLVEVEVEVGNFPTTNKELIKQDDVKRLVVSFKGQSSMFHHLLEDELLHHMTVEMYNFIYFTNFYSHTFDEEPTNCMLPSCMPLR